MVAVRSRENSDFDAHRSNGETLDLVSDASNDLVSAAFDWLPSRNWISTTTTSFYRYQDVAEFDGELSQLAKRSNSPDLEVAAGFGDFNFDREFLMSDASLRQDVTWAAGAGHTLGLGAEIHRLETAVRWESFDSARNLQEANGSSVRGGAGLPDFVDSTVGSTRGGLYVQDRWRAGRGLTLEPGLRFDWSTASQRSTLSPRLAASFDLGPRTALRAAVGKYTQSPGYEKLIQSDYFLDLTGARMLDYERATHFVVGIERGLGESLVARVEGYYKKFSDLIVGRLETERERLQRVSEYDFPEELQDSVPRAPMITTAPSNDSRGRAYGVDLYVARRDPSARIAGWLSYTLGKAERQAYSRVYPMEYDRRHALDLVGRYRWSERFDVAVTARLASGFPYTPAVGLRVSAVEDDRGKLVPETDSEGNLVYAADLGSVEDLNRGRLPAYARVDVRATFRPGGAAGRWSVYVEVINLFNRDNAVRLDTWLVHDPASDFPRIVEMPSEGFPLLPSAGVRVHF
jgi:outer membrane receptor for ferrienterochelin and colicin